MRYNERDDVGLMSRRLHRVPTPDQLDVQAAEPITARTPHAPPVVPAATGLARPQER